MDNISFRLVRTGNPKTVRFEVREGDVVKVAGDADASTVAGFIENLWHARAELEPAVPTEFDQSAPHLRLENPSWRADWRPSDAALSLTVRHPGLGWLAFSFAGEALEHFLRFTQSRPEPAKAPRQDGPRRH